MPLSRLHFLAVLCASLLTACGAADTLPATATTASASTDHPYAQAHTIIERDGIRIGVIGIMGQDAATAIIPSYIAPLDVHDPAPAVRKSVAELRDQVDLIVLLTHQGKTAPMQTDAETDPRLQRDIDADIGMVHGGSLRKDLPQGDIRLVDILDSRNHEVVAVPERGRQWPVQKD